MLVQDVGSGFWVQEVGSGPGFLILIRDFGSGFWQRIFAKDLGS